MVFTNTALANIGDGSGLQPSATAGSLYVALYTVAPSDAGGGTECTYTGYGRVAVARSGAGWTVASGVAENAAAVTFGACTAGSETAVAFSIMTAASSGDMLFWGDLTANLNISAGITPEFAAGELTITED
ncbi:hypothetical protein JW960_26175 [candidate division KSB1 bacterium]|nr:hypothetical protein [candidate division KSB1 bacterium]